MLVGDISISSEGNWVVNGVDTGVKATGDRGITPVLRIYNNKLQVSYNEGGSYVDINDTPVYTQFRVNNNHLEQSVNLGQTWTVVSDPIAAWFKWVVTGNNLGKIQISRDNQQTWQDLSSEFVNNLYIKGYVATVSDLPSSATQGDIYGVGPTYDPSDTEHTNPIYQLYVKDSTGWVNNGRFTSISAGVVQELGNSETSVISQAGVSDSLRSANIIPKLNLIKEGDFVEGKYYGGGNALIDRINFKYNPVGIKLMPNWNYVYTGGIFAQASINLLTEGGVLFRRIYFPDSLESSYINTVSFTTPNTPLVAYISYYTLSDTALGLFEDLSQDIPNKLGKSYIDLSIDWVDGYYYNNNGVLTEYTGTASKFAAASIDITNITGQYYVRGYCLQGYEAKCIIIDNMGTKRYFSLDGSVTQINLEDTDVTLLLSTAYNNVPLEKSYVRTATYRRIADIENKLLDIGSSSSPLRDIKFSILGDSISTFQGYIPDGYLSQYPFGDVTSVDMTYWGKLISKDKMVLEVNNSWAGTLLSKWENQVDISLCDDRRLSNLGNPDIILIFGGTNDYGYKDRWRTIGDLNLEGTTLDVTVFKPALQYTVQYLQKKYPKALICFLIPLQRGRYHEYGDEILDYPSKNGLGLFEFQYRDAIKEVANIYGCEVIDTNKCGITYYNGTNNPTGSGGTNLYMVDGVHPNAAGMEIIYQYVRSWLISKLNSK